MTDQRVLKLSQQTLIVFYKTFKVGKVYLDTSGFFCFEYFNEWLSSPDSFAISHSLPLAGITYVDSAHTYFGNLLPEGKIRKLISGRLGVSAENDFELLKALGEDCAGAFTLRPLERFEKKSAPHYKPISIKAIAKAFTDQPIFYLGFSETELRLSLAGAQDKVALFSKDNKFFLPQNGAPSSHILKFPSKDYAYLAENEYLISQLALDCEMSISPMSLVTEGAFTALLSERYDRQQLLGKLERQHQEDFCQALGISYKNKYQQEGGPSIKSSFELLEQVSVSPLRDIQQLLKWVVFNVCVGNYDNHGKNLSLLRTAENRWQLSPFYDLLCTRIYKSISKKQAMSIGGSFDGANLSINNWQIMSADIKYSYHNLLREIALPIIDTIQMRIDDHALEFRKKKSYNFIKMLAHEVKSLTKQVERSFFQ